MQHVAFENKVIKEAATIIETNKPSGTGNDSDKLS